MSINKTKAHPISKYAILGLSSAMAVAAFTHGACADPVSPAGWTSNIQLGTPLPEGLYLIDTGAYYLRDSKGAGFPSINAIVNIPAFVWSTPATLLGGRLETILLVPEVGVGINPNAGVGSAYYRDIYNPAALVGMAWNLGGGFSFADHVGTFFPVNTPVGNLLGLGGNFFTFTEIAALSYNNSQGWGATANLTYLHSGNDIGTGLYDQPDTLDLDLAVVKHFDKLEIGLVAYGSTDLNTALRNVGGRQSQIALGGLVGYNFGPVTAELFATRDVAEANYTGYDTRIWGRLVFPLWNPPTPPAAPLVSKY